MQLPVEVRLQIYAYAFHRFELSDGPQGIVVHSGSKHSTNMLCRVSKAIRLEAIPVLAEQTKILLVDTTHLTAPSDAGYAATYKPRLRYEWLMNIEVLAFGCTIKLLPEFLRFPRLKAVVVMQTVIWGMLHCALPTKSTILRLTKSDYLSTPSNWVQPLIFESNRQFKIWGRMVFVGLDETTSEFERFTELVALRELLASALWFEVKPASLSRAYCH